jgi:DNA-binding NtrC family response regulator
VVGGIPVWGISPTVNSAWIARAFLAYFRAVKKGEAPQSAEANGAQTRAETNPPRRILVVDDDGDIRRLNAELLTRFGYQTETAEDGAAAWEALQARQYDLLITDNKMPKVSGVELVQKARSAQMTLPVILASGTLPSQDYVRSARLQPVAMLVKPFSSRQLLGTVERVLRETDSFDYLP